MFRLSEDQSNSGVCVFLGVACAALFRSVAGKLRVITYSECRLWFYLPTGA